MLAFSLFIAMIGCIVISALLLGIAIYFDPDNKWRIFFIGWSIIGGLGLLLIALLEIDNYYTSKMTVDRDDIYGTYVIDRDRYPGKNSDWQYEHFRFEITPTDSFKFYVTDMDKISKIYKGKVAFSQGRSEHLIFKADTPRYHVFREDPTLYCLPLSFYYVFKSPLYGNMFFKKGEYK